MRVLTRLFGFMLLAASVLLASAPANAQGNMLETIKKRGKLQVGYGSFVPWALRDKQGNWIGFEIDVTTKLAKDMGVDVELMPTAWDGIIPSLLAGKFDAIFGMTVIGEVHPDRMLAVGQPRGFTQQQVAVASQLDQRVALAGVRGVDQ